MCVCVCKAVKVCVCVCVCWREGGMYHIQRLTNLLFSQEKTERLLAVDNSVLCFNILDQILLLFLFLVYVERFCLNVGVKQFENELTNK